jgi:hypothetical protein
MTMTCLAVAKLVGTVSTVAFCAVALTAANGTDDQTRFSPAALKMRLPEARTASYIVNAKVRPLLLFWIGRDDIGGADITWRRGVNGHRSLELLIGSDPTRAPRHINRWGFIVEELGDTDAHVLGVMRESNEQTLEEAEERIARQEGTDIFKAVRTTITGPQAMTGTMTVQAPSGLTYRDLDALLALLPAVPQKFRTVELPPGTQRGFLVALDSLIRSSVDACGLEGGGLREVPAVAYLYNQTLYDLKLTACSFEQEFQTKSGTFGDVVDGHFQLRNRTTKNNTKFSVVFGTSGEFHALPVRAVFRPRWWMEIELILDQSRNPDQSRNHVP